MTETESDAMASNYQKYIARKLLFIGICIVGVVLTIGYAATIGSADLTALQVYEAIYTHFFDSGNIDVTTDWVVFTVRLPRIMTGMVAGASLGIAGAAMQSMMKNPLADPYTTGISSGASFGATLALGLGFTLFGIGGSAGIVVMAFIFSLIPAAVIILVSSMRHTSAATMILAGIAVMYLFNACTTIIKLTLSEQSLSAVYQWSIGDLSGSTWESFQVIAIFCVVGGFILMAMSKKLNILITGDKNAKALGLDAHKLRIVLLIVISLMAASVVCFTGIIGFVGLVAPHIVRIFLGSDNRYLIPASAAFGAVLLMVSDLVSRVIIAPTFLPVGVITAFIGCPLFMWLLIRARKSMW
ncbi:MAG: iron ABC transporter permease [Candidatus Methanomethylophilaceae archaeon]|nr:iron ABC transporter permease [Candidatus Methanomethylophilaceae archaeon]